jgi:hypothetical protein
MGNTQRLVLGIVAAALGVLVAQPLAGTAAILPQHTAASAVPQLTVPSATVPSVSTPVGTTPSVTTPPATTPRVTTPSATTPSVSVPSVTTPPASTPVATVPSVTTPSASAPSPAAPTRTAASKVSALVGGATHSAQASGAPGDPASAAPDIAAVSSGAGRGASAPPAAGGDGAGAAATRVMSRVARADRARSRGGVHSHRADRSRRIAAARESRRLRRLVSRLHGCLEALGVGARRLLSLRAGLHGPVRSAVATARILHVSSRREARLERRALRALQRSAATGCAGPAPAAAVAPALASAATPSSSGLRLSGGTTSTGPAASLSAAHAERGPAGSRTLSIVPPARRAVERAETGSSFPGLLIPALLALLLGVAVLALPETRRRLRPAAAAHPSSATETDVAGLQTDPPRLARTIIAPRTTPMDAAMAQMAAAVFAAMASGTPEADPDPQPEGQGSDRQAQVEHDDADRRQ